MININLTLIVQAINFIIAYYLLKHLYLKPILDLNTKDEFKIKAIESELNSEIMILKQKNALKESKWNSYKSLFKQDIFKLSEIKYIKRPFNIGIKFDQNISEAEILKTAQNIANNLEKKVM